MISLMFRGNHLIFLLSFIKHSISIAALVATISSNPFATQFMHAASHLDKTEMVFKKRAFESANCS